MRKIFGKFGVAVVLGTVALSGCATTGSVKRAQMRADEAYAVGENGVGAAQRAQGAADNAYGAAQHAQGSADNAYGAAQRAQSSADAAGVAAQGATGEIARLNSRIRRLEVEQAKLKKQLHPHHAHMQRKAVKGQPMAQFHSGN